MAEVKNPGPAADVKHPAEANNANERVPPRKVQEKVDPEVEKLAKSLLTFVNDKTKYQAFQDYVDFKSAKHREVLETPGYNETMYAHHRGALSELKTFAKFKDLIQSIANGKDNGHSW